jgi:hypothetical protein
VDDRELGAVAQKGVSSPHGIRVAIESDHAAARGGQHRATVAAAAERGVDVQAAVAQVEGGESLVEKNGPMGHSAFPQTGYQQAAAGIRPDV